jgi:predicted DNA-binding WGR domain protein
MDNLLNIVLEAHNPAINAHRRYELVVGRDLFGDWTLTIRFGRIGTHGQSQHFSSRNPRDLQRIMRERLRRRRGSTQRIGCSYRLTSCSASPRLDRSAWLPR